MADALDIFTSGSYPVDLVSMSYSWNSTDTTCAGTGTLNTNADAMFEAGVAFFKSAGNNGNRTTTNCTCTPTCFSWAIGHKKLGLG